MGWSYKIGLFCLLGVCVFPIGESMVLVFVFSSLICFCDFRLCV